MQRAYHPISDVKSEVCGLAVLVPIQSNYAHTPLTRTDSPLEHRDVLAGRVVQRSHIPDLPARLSLPVQSPHTRRLRLQLLH